MIEAREVQIGSRGLRIATACVALATLILGAAAGDTRSFTHRIEGSPLLAMELARGQEDVSRILGSAEDPANDRIRFQHLVLLDFSFIPAYTLLFLLISALFWAGGDRLLGITVPMLITVAATSDAFGENRAMLDLLSGGNSAPHGWSLLKWGLVFASFALTSRIFLKPYAAGKVQTLGHICFLVAICTGVVGEIGVVGDLVRVLETTNKVGLPLGLVSTLLFFVVQSLYYRAPTL